MGDDDIRLEDAEWWDYCREQGSRSFPEGMLEQRKSIVLRRMAKQNAELERMVAEHLADPSKPDPRTWVF
jgi:hypothetical protein